ncbi:MAG: hypothetical protein GY808_00920, partial [Gammaproteobacteria bacterium]|nr:hypothetical protein [Gammaproteobacteria bacterium]
MNSMYGMDGTYHVVMGAIQGYADIYASTQIDIFPLIYWNAREQQFVELSDFNKSHPADTTVQTILVNNRPGNGLGGFNYPTLSEGPNGELVCIWQEWEENGNGMPVIVTPAGGFPIFCTDIWGAYSPDGGRSWSIPFFVAGTPGESDVYPNIAKKFSFDSSGDSIVIDIAYMWDTNAGVSLFGGGNDASECIWYYERVSVFPQFGQIPFITSVNPDSAYTGQNLSVSIIGQNTIFLQDTITTDHVYFLMGNDTIEASNVNVLNTTALIADFSIPTTATTGYWDVNVEQVGGAGVVRWSNGFWIYERLVDSLSLSVETTDAFAGDTVVI